MVSYWGPGCGWEASQAHGGAVGHEMGTKSSVCEASQAGFLVFCRGNPAFEASHAKEVVSICPAVPAWACETSQHHQGPNRLPSQPNLTSLLMWGPVQCVALVCHSSLTCLGPLRGFKNTSRVEGTILLSILEALLYGFGRADVEDIHWSHGCSFF
jgi:hypothetical protein